MAYQQPCQDYNPYRRNPQSNGQSHNTPIFYPHVAIAAQPRGEIEDFQPLPQNDPNSIPNQSMLINGRQENSEYVQHQSTLLGDKSSSIQAQSLPAGPTHLIRKALYSPDYPIDYQLLLLSLADEYLLAALSQHDQDVNEYCKLVATSLGCMEALLKKWRLQPLIEAKLRLKYSRVLYEETENLLEAETALSKGIDLCERNRFIDLKYAMQVLLVWILNRSNKKAALKAADGMIEDVQVYRQTAWEYAFRFLCAGLAASGSAQQDSSLALYHLQSISGLAERSGDKAIFFAAAIMEGFTYLQSASAECVSHAQRALAKARQLQLDAEAQGIVQLQIMTLLLDLACSLLLGDTVQTTRKMQVLQSFYDYTMSNSAWSSDGVILLPLSSRSLNGVVLHSQEVVQIEDGKPYLCLSWLSRGEVYVLCNLFNAAAISHKNPADGHKAEQFLLESIRSLESGNMLSGRQTTSGASFRKALSDRNFLRFHCFVQFALLKASRGDWTSARKYHKEAKILCTDDINPSVSTVTSLIKYLEGVLAQGAGDLDSALRIYQHDSLSLNRTFTKSLTSNINRDLSILSACNTIFIVHLPTHPSHHLLNTLLLHLLPYHQQHQQHQQNPNTTSAGGIPRLLTAALSLTSSLLPTSTDSILKTKQHLSLALNTAREISNNQIQCMTLALMSNRFFKGVVCEQADKAGRAGRAMASKLGSPLWLSVTDGVVADGLEMRGRKEEAGVAWREALRYADMLPDGVKPVP